MDNANIASVGIFWGIVRNYVGRAELRGTVHVRPIFGEAI